MHKYVNYWKQHISRDFVVVCCYIYAYCTKVRQQLEIWSNLRYHTIVTYLLTYTSCDSYATQRCWAIEILLTQ